jgi:uncharacterized protein YbjT (DUF2867 family)/membrane protease YdiL (CAAX protease family)
MASRILVAGASGFVGRRLCPALVAAGHQVVAMTRHPETYAGAGEPVRGDVHDPESLRSAMAGCTAAYYLVHSLDSPDFERLDAAAASAFGEAAAAAGVSRIVYLGGLGRDDDALSPHLRSRREVELLLGAAGVPVTTLRAGIVIGHQGLSWEMTRQLVERLPVMVTPRWVATRTQPIALADVVRYLVAVLDVEETTGRAFEIGGDEVLRYSDMMRRVAAVEGRPLTILPVPLLSPRLSSRWLSLVTDVDAAAGRSLVDSMVNEVVVEDDELHRLVPFPRRSFDDAVRDALAEQEGAQGTGFGGLVASLKDRLPVSLLHHSTAHRDQPGHVLRRRRRIVTATSLVGAGLLGVGLASRPGSRSFYAATLGLAVVWTVGGVASGPLHLGSARKQDEPVRRPVVVPVATGVAAFGFFYGCALVARRVPALSSAICSVLAYAQEGRARPVLVSALANAAAEEVFFRGAVYAAFHDHAATRTTTVYVLATLPTRNPALVLAAGVMGGLWALQRRATGGVQAPMLTHLTWSALMVRYLPPLFRDQSAPPARPFRAG